MVFYEAWRRRDYVRMVNSSIAAWLLVTANYTIQNDFRQRRRYRNFLSRLPQPATGPDIADTFVDAEDQEQQAVTLREAFAQLRGPDRDVLTLCVVEGMSIRDAAAALGIPEGTVKSRLNRAKSRLGHLYNEISSDHASDPQVVHGRRTT
ncbi:UNVERIFIED_ORG: RNA polymerase sigma factor (sigma-70 family) [Arthrobacter sp. UYCu721]